MTRDDVIRLAREAGGLAFSHALIFTWVERFADLVAAAEREALSQPERRRISDAPIYIASDGGFYSRPLNQTLAEPPPASWVIAKQP